MIWRIRTEDRTLASAAPSSVVAAAMFSARQAPFTISASLLMALQPLLLTLSKDDDGYFAYSVPSATMFCELMKLAFSLGALALMLFQQPELRSKTISDRPLMEFAQFLVPSLIYFANNNLAFVILQSLDPTTFQLISQTKTIFTGILFRFMLKKRLGIFQWMALFFLACGTACSQIPTASPSSEGDSHGLMLLEASSSAENKTPIPAAVGVGVSLVTALFSSLAGVYNEKLLKGRVFAPIHWQNVQMYIHGFWLNLVFMLIYDGAEIKEKGLLHGYTAIAWAAVVCNAFVGLAVSAVLKYCDNIARVYAHSISLVVVLVVSVPLFGLDPTAQLVLALLLVIASTVQYNIPKTFDDAFDLIPDPVPGEDAKITKA